MSKKPTKLSIAMKLCEPLHPGSTTNTHYICKLCNSTMSGVQPSNITAHMESKHREKFNSEWKAVASGSLQQEMEILRMEMIQNMTEIVTVNCRPFSSLSDSGFQKIMRRDIDLLDSAGLAHGITLNGKIPPAVEDHMKHLAESIMKIIEEEVKDIPVSMMVDIGTRNGRDILGVSIQYFRNGRVVVRSIGNFEFPIAHTGENIKIKILECLKTFKISPSQVISITSDNASNMLSMIKSFNRELDKEGAHNAGNWNDDERNDTTDADYFDSMISNDEIAKIVDEYNSVNSMTDIELEAERRNAEANAILDEDSYYLDLLKDLQNDFVLHTIHTSGIKCAAHTLQLGINDWLKLPRISVLLNVCRAGCKLLKKSSYRQRANAQKLEMKIPPRDNATRWNSAYRMVSLQF